MDFTSLLSALHLLIEPAFAQAAPPLPACGNFVNLFGCGGVSNVLATTTIPNVAVFFLRIVAASSVLFVVWAGVRMMVFYEKRQEARVGVAYALVGLAVALGSQMIVGFVTTENYGQGNVGDFVVGGLIRSAVRLLLSVVNVILGLVIIIQGFRMVAAQGKTDAFNEARGSLLSAVMGAIVVNAALAMVRVVTTFFGV
jgi:hypothetical protein